MSYGFHVWCNISSAQMERLRVFERRVLRACLGLKFDRVNLKYCKNIDIYNKYKAPRIDEALISMACRFYEKCENHTNPSVRKLTLENYVVEGQRWKSSPNIIYKNQNLYNNENKLIYYNTRYNNNGSYVYTLPDQ